MAAEDGRPAERPTGRLHEVEFDELLREVLDRMHGVLDEQARLRLLLDAVVTMAADLSLDGVLSRIVSIASPLVDAQVRRARRARSWAGATAAHVHPPRHGPDEVAQIGDLPTGHGLLGLIIDRPSRCACTTSPRTPRRTDSRRTTRP